MNLPDDGNTEVIDAIANVVREENIERLAQPMEPYEDDVDSIEAMFRLHRSELNLCELPPPRQNWDPASRHLLNFKPPPPPPN
ncbi:hypothetical protein J8273_3194 [Carpediemonas membranifera]|uniref:Uncharacterized protein n=1 Tax=Carpediemonas membranifera TaxID=201153 RepID=A0A8J6AUU9_9EUKA|nr:hypothetical protein J8273_3194 [Carpediemonas membranifera]|eukprot:KAG9393065.1 hypothetical protein J8273_3194 [Carpediemonas membranifera]